MVNDDYTMYDLKKEGKIHIITGFGKYKTSAAFGTALRAINQNWKILIVQFLKGKKSGEIEIFEKYFKDNVDILRYGFNKIALPNNIEVSDKDESQRGWEEMLHAIEINNYDLLILDEVLPSVDLKLLTQKQLFDLFDNKPKALEVICTGRVSNKIFMDNLTAKSSLHSDIVCKRHYFSCKCPECNRSWEYHYTYCPNCGVELGKYTSARLGIEI